MKKNTKTIERNPLYVMMSKFLGLYLVVGFLLRIVLMVLSPDDASYTFGSILRLLSIGVLSDFGTGLLLFIPLLFVYLGLNEWKYSKVGGWLIELLLLAGLLYTLCCHSIFDEYGGGAPLIAKAFLSWKLFSFTLRFLLPRLRDTWRKVTLYATWGLYVFLFLFISMGEVIFWQEFGVRYNFIAVDYLVYTNEVIGNILESYAVVPLLIGVLVATVGIVFWNSRKTRFRLTKLYTPRLLAVHLGCYAVLALLGYLIVWATHALQSDNQYVTQLEQNGICDFCIAFQSNKLDYDKFYPMLPEAEARAIYRREAGLDSNGRKTIGDSLASNRPNIVLITVESLSADFLTRYGNKQNLTPTLDSLMDKSLVFDRLYAVGNRTVRGLEALSLCIPPSSGESIIKRKQNNMGNLSVGMVLKRLGYHVQFFYGGDSYFDNMGNFFGRNGYEVIDRKHILPEDITFANIWGVCDEDIFHKSLSVFDADAKQGKPFFAQIMTTSNHRPYTYPAGKIHVDGDPHTREAAVRYTDYAIGQLLREAARRPWFANTLFVVIADHCASSAGKTSLPIDRYHIPCLVYAPQLVKPAYIDKVCSQIDVMPTVLSLLHLRTEVGFTGKDILASSFRPRAFMATYQDLGYYEANRLTVLSPVRNVRQFTVRPLSDGTFDEQPANQIDGTLLRKAEANYQYVNLYLKAR